LSAGLILKITSGQASFKRKSSLNAFKCTSLQIKKVQWTKGIEPPAHCRTQCRAWESLTCQTCSSAITTEKITLAERKQRSILLTATPFNGQCMLSSTSCGLDFQCIATLAVRLLTLHQAHVQPQGQPHAIRPISFLIFRCCSFARSFHFQDLSCSL